ncbi:DUF6049 family protein [Microbacterium sp.]|uniref:DUF6049 family protein n=1 Tax=Microbacterium sp. TaxID=51671 RepID=UPI0028120152|nr:DUF6049 family protein [Microbacterium sp.]
MTASLPRIGIRPRAQRLLSRLAAALVIGALAFGGAAPAHGAAEEAAEDAGAVELTVTTGNGAPTAPGGPLTGGIDLTNRTESALSAGAVTVELNRTAITDSSALEAWLEGGTASGVFETIAVQPTPAVESGSSTSADLLVSAPELGALRPGVYPVRARLSGASIDGEDGPVAQHAASTTVLVISDAVRRTGVLIPITATPEDGALLTSDELAELTGDGGALAGQLDAVAGTTAILAVDPAIPTAIRMLGTRAPASAVDWLERLESLPNDVFLLQFGDADAAVQAHAAQPTLLAPQDLSPLLQESDFPPPTTAPTPSPSPSTTPEPAVPDNAELAALRGATDGILWPRGEVTADDLATFSGYIGERLTTVLPSSSVDGATGAHATAGEHDLLITDAPASARLSSAVAQQNGASRDRELTAVTAHLMLGAQGPTTVLLGLDRSETRSPVALRAALTAFAAPGVTLPALRGEPAASVTVHGEPDAARAEALTAMLADEQRLVTFSTVLEEPSLLLAPHRIRMLRAIGAGLGEEEFSAASARLAQRTIDTLNAVSVQQPKPVQLFTSAAPLPVWVRNDLPWPVKVSLSSQPSDPRLDIQPLTEVEALESSSTRVDVPIEARVASGEVQVTFRLFSPTGVPVGQPTTADVTLRADWEGIGLVILGGLISVLFVLGLVRTVLRRRRVDAAATKGNDE